MSPGSPDASDELQVIPRRPSDGPPGAGNSRPPPLASAAPHADPARQKRLTRIVAVALGLCAFILVAAGIARLLRPRGESAGASASASASAAAAPSVAPAASAAAAPSTAPVASAPPAPTTGTVVFDRPATPGKIWIDGKKVTTKSVDLSCGTHKIKIGLYGKTKPVPITCGAELHLSR